MVLYLDARNYGSSVTDPHLVNRLVFRQPFEHQPLTHMPGTKANHFNNEEVKVHYSDASAIQIDPHCV